MRASGLYPASDVGLIATGERTGNVEEAFGRLADYYHRDAASALSRIPVIAQYGLLILGALFTACLVGYGMRFYVSTLFDIIHE